jgi:hypothetical protein
MRPLRKEAVVEAVAVEAGFTILSMFSARRSAGREEAVFSRRLRGRKINVF